MQIITISCGSQNYGQQFAKNLAAKLGYLCIGREELLEEVTNLYLYADHRLAEFAM